jgi:hypothetical protein
MQVFVVLLNNEIMSVCGDKQTANWEKEMIQLVEGQDDVKIKVCGVCTYDEDYHKRDLEAYLQLTKENGDFYGY